MSDNTFEFQADDGFALNCFQWFPEDTSSLKGVLLFSHGLAEHAARYERLAHKLNDAGYGVYAHDQRGHGRSISKPKELGFYSESDGWNKLINDLLSLNQYIAKKHPDVPIFLLGHSMGSMISQEYIIRHGDTVRGAVLSASIDDAGALRHIGLLIARLERWRMGAYGRSKILNAMSFGDYSKPFKPNRTEFDWLSRDEAEVDKYVADPLCGFIATTQLWIDFLIGIGEFTKPKRRALVRNDLPLYLLTGSMDPVTRMGKAVTGLEAAYRKGGVKGITVKIYPDARHECFNEINRDEVTQDLIDWLDRVLG